MSAVASNTGRQAISPLVSWKAPLFPTCRSTAGRGSDALPYRIWLLASLLTDLPEFLDLLFVIESVDTVDIKVH